MRIESERYEQILLVLPVKYTNNSDVTLRERDTASALAIAARPFHYIEIHS